MDGTLIDHFRAFHTYSKEQELSASTRSIYFTLLGEFNVGFWPEELSFSDRTLQELSGVKSLSTIHDARNLLKSLNLIDFRKGKNRKIIYKLLSEHLANTNRTPSMQLPEHQANTCRTASEHSGLVSNAYAREDFKTERLEDSFQQQIQRAREAKESSNVKEEMDVHDLWEYETGYRLTGSIAYELEELESTHGRESFHAALKQAVASNNRGRVTFNYFKAILEKKKGGERVGKSDSSAPNGGITYDLTGTDVIPDWAKDLA